MSVLMHLFTNLQLFNMISHHILADMPSSSAITGGGASTDHHQTDNGAVVDSPSQSPVGSTEEHAAMNTSMESAGSGVGVGGNAEVVVGADGIAIERRKVQHEKLLTAIFIRVSR